MSVAYSAFALASGRAALEDEKRQFRIGDGEVMPGAAATFTGAGSTVEED